MFTPRCFCTGVFLMKILCLSLESTRDHFTLFKRIYIVFIASSIHAHSCEYSVDLFWESFDTDCSWSRGLGSWWTYIQRVEVGRDRESEISFMGLLDIKVTWGPNDLVQHIHMWNYFTSQRTTDTRKRAHTQKHMYFHINIYHTKSLEAKFRSPSTTIQYN